MEPVSASDTGSLKPSPALPFSDLLRSPSMPLSSLARRCSIFFHSGSRQIGLVYLSRPFFSLSPLSSHPCLGAFLFPLPFLYSSARKPNRRLSSDLNAHPFTHITKKKKKKHTHTHTHTFPQTFHTHIHTLVLGDEDASVEQEPFFRNSSYIWLEV